MTIINGPVQYVYFNNIGPTGPTGPQGLRGSTGVGGALGYYGSFYDTTIQTNLIGNTGIAMKYNTTSESNGVSIVDLTKVTFEAAGVYNIQFSAQFDKTDAGTDRVDIWLRQNGIDVPYSNTRLTSYNNNDKFVGSWNFMQSLNANDYLELIWASADTQMRIYSETELLVPPYSPAIPSVILTVQQVMNTQIGPTGPPGFQTGPTFSAYNSSGVVMTGGLFTLLTQDSKEFDTSGCFNNTSSTATLNGLSVPPYAFCPNIAGYYQIDGQMSFSAMTAGSGKVVESIYKNGTEFKRGIRNNINTSGSGSLISAIVYLNGTGDYIQLYGLQDGSSSSFETTESGPIVGCYFQASLIRGI
jgi:hypothetical protein